MRTFTLGAGADVVKFTSASAADANTITNFGTTDKLSFLKTAFSINWQSSDNFTEAFNSGKIAADKVYFGTNITDAAVGSLATNSSNANALAITQTGKIYYIADTSGGSITQTLVVP